MSTAYFKIVCLSQVQRSDYRRSVVYFFGRGLSLEITILRRKMELFKFRYTAAPELTYFLSDPMTLYSSSEMIRKLSVIVLVNSRHLSGRVLRKNPKIASVNWLNVA